MSVMPYFQARLHSAANSVPRYIKPILSATTSISTLTIFCWLYQLIPVGSSISVSSPQGIPLPPIREGERQVPDHLNKT